GGQEKAGARTARQACERLGLERHRVDLVAWLVEHHLVMSDTAQKRDLADPATITAFTQMVATPERLRLLLILTVADIRAVGPGVWNGWKGQLLRELYGAAETVFRGGRTSDPEGVARRRQEALAYDARAALVARDGSSRAWAAGMEDAYFSSFALSEQLSHLALARRAAAGSGAAAESRIDPVRQAAEIVVAARDRRGLFADLALAISDLGGNVVGARIFTSERGEALDVFYVQDAAGDPFGADHPRQLARLTSAVEAAALGARPASEPLTAPDLGRASAFSIAPMVAIDSDASPKATVVEASGRDRAGLLEALARTLAEADLSILSAHVDNYGERAVDSFYVVDADGRKLADPDRMDAVRARLIEALQAGEPAVGRARLTKARASAAR
ncbi:MAG: HD domain-containing protein, partial [Caulobacteraceae bacterium]|nr:HD domain-containing protein [Caulobacteraceae bacterium]